MMFRKGKRGALGILESQSIQMGNAERKREDVGICL